MDFPWPWWLATSLFFLTLALWGKRLIGGWTSRLFLGWILGGLVALPLWHHLTRAAIIRLYSGGSPAFLARMLLPSRHALPLAHYTTRVDALFVQALVWITWLHFLLAVGGVLYFRPSPQRPLPRSLLLWTALVALVLLPYGGFELAFRLPHPVFYTGCPKLWGHRGHPEPPAILEDTIESFQRAFDLGAPGVEMDVAYDPKTGRFYIHRYDNPAIPPTPLEEVFRRLGHRGYFWIDLKTLHHLSPEAARRAAQDMYRLLTRYGLLDRVIVESDTPHNLRYMAQAGIHTSFWIFNMDESQVPKTPWGYWFRVYWYKAWYIRGRFSAISMDRKFYTPALALALSGARIHLFTVNDPDDLRRLTAHPQVRVILTDRARYDLAACP